MTTKIDLAPQPVWIGGKLVAPKGYISPETREAIRKATEGCLDESCHRETSSGPTERGLVTDPLNGYR